MTRPEFSVGFDDELTYFLIGPETKYINMAGNVFYRDMIGDDFVYMNNLIGENVDTDFGFVVTFYMITSGVSFRGGLKYVIHILKYGSKKGTEFYPACPSLPPKCN